MEILKSYSEVMRELHLTVLDSTLPDLCRYEKEITHAKRAFSVARCCRLQPDNWKAAVWWNLRKSLWSNLNLDSHEKKIVEVDEDVLKEIIVGDIPVFGKDSPAPKEKSVEHQEAKSPAATVPADTPAEKPSVEKPKRKKDESFGYRERFLVNIPASNRSHVYINREVAECIKRVLPVIAPEMSISGFISNILVDHLQKHWDEINELYNKEYYKPLKPF